MNRDRLWLIRVPQDGAPGTYSVSVGAQQTEQLEQFVHYLPSRADLLTLVDSIDSTRGRSDSLRYMREMLVRGDGAGLLSFLEQGPFQLRALLLDTNHNHVFPFWDAASLAMHPQATLLVGLSPVYVRQIQALDSEADGVVILEDPAHEVANMAWKNDDIINNQDKTGGEGRQRPDGYRRARKRATRAGRGDSSDSVWVARKENVRNRKRKAKIARVPKRSFHHKFKLIAQNQNKTR